MAVIQEKAIKASAVACCPELTEKPCCNRLTFDYRLVNRVGDIPVEIKISVLFERCPGPLSLGDLVYSTTLLPGETVRLYSSSRKNRFTFDSESQVSYRHEQTSEESYYMSSVDRFMSDLSVRDDVEADRSSSGSFKTDGSTSGAIETFFSGASVSVSGSYNASSTFDFLRELKSHAESSHERSVEATRAASSVAVGEVQTRNHAEGESESTFEAATRSISNPNRCHAVTYFAYQINKTQIVRFKILSITRRIIDPAGDSKVATLPPRFAGEVSVIPQGVLATAGNRVNVESVARASFVADRAGAVSSGGGDIAGSVQGVQFASRTQAAQRFVNAQPISDAARQRALQAVDKELVAAGLLDKENGKVNPKLAAELSFELQSCLPTPAILVKGCLDECTVCEPAREQEIKLELERKELENKLLAKRIDLLEKSQEYRCCPVGEEEEDA
ncbi:hypothetical protein AAFN88_18410 [Pelagibius sp. CAU 1746]|uniref:hypothetical protein n=1 Tax=Pelagibius sp. CAU 1746 TaxID=3140370 RepID=UPI00325BF6C2